MSECQSKQLQWWKRFKVCRIGNFVLAFLHRSISVHYILSHPFARHLSFSTFRVAWILLWLLSPKYILYGFNDDDLCECCFYSFHSLYCSVASRSTKMMTMNNLIITLRMCNIVEFKVNPPSTPSLRTHFAIVRSFSSSLFLRVCYSLTVSCFSCSWARHWFAKRQWERMYYGKYVNIFHNHLPYCQYARICRCHCFYLS